MEFALPTADEFTQELKELGKAMQGMGITAYELTQTVRQMAESFDLIHWAHNEIANIKDSLNDLRSELDTVIQVSSGRTDVLEMEVDKLRSDLDAMTEIPNQKDDLENSEQIVWNKDFLFSNGVGWSSDIVDIDKTNIFLN